MLRYIVKTDEIIIITTRIIKNIKLLDIICLSSCLTYILVYFAKLIITLYFLKTCYSNLINKYLHSIKTKVTTMKVYKQSLLIYQLQYSFIGPLISIGKH